MAYKDPIRRKEYLKAYRQAHKEYLKAKMKAYYKSNKEYEKSKMKAWKEAHREQLNAYSREYTKSDINEQGELKHNIRKKSRRILKQMKLHIDGYEIHHCFGYKDPSKFIYCSKALHNKIHQLLRDHGIDSSIDHWMHIRDLVNSTDEFWYIKD